MALKKRYENQTLIVGNMKKIKVIEIAKIIKRITNSKSKIILNKKNKRFDDFDLNKVKILVLKIIWDIKVNIV